MTLPPEFFSDWTWEWEAAPVAGLDLIAEKKVLEAAVETLTNISKCINDIRRRASESAAELAVAEMVSDAAFILRSNGTVGVLFFDGELTIQESLDKMTAEFIKDEEPDSYLPLAETLEQAAKRLRDAAAAGGEES